MAKVAYVCLRNGSEKRFESLRKTLTQVSIRICPDNIEPRAPRIIDQSGVIAAVFSPSEAVRVLGASICAGHLTNNVNWELPGGAAPDGAFALFRADRATVEVLSDAVASRNVWYYFDDDILIAATTQRAIVALLGSFEFNWAAIPWMLTNGSLGPIPGWDLRVRRLGPDSRLTVDRERWRSSVVVQDISFSSNDLGASAQRESFLRCLKNTFAPIRFDYRKWVMPLSGGYDSRGILCLLPDTAGMRTITWGLAASQRQRGNDAAVAREVAAALGVTHEFRVTDVADEPAERILDRFVVAGEGCIDHLSGYLDGFAIWKSLYDEGVEGIIRGDEGFGWTSVKSPADVLASIGISLWNDDENLPSLESLGFPAQTMPEALERRSAESLEQWRDRLYHQYRIPTVLAALNDLKLPYVEVANPLLARPILDFVRSMPDEQRTEKRLFRAIVGSIGPKIRIARDSATTDLRSILKTRDVVLVLREALTSATARGIFPQSFLELIDTKIVRADTPARIGWKSQLRRLIRPLVPGVLKIQVPRSSPATMIDFNAVAFRIYLICRMYELLTEDARIVDST
jgi:hypothetical protein